MTSPPNPAEFTRMTGTEFKDMRLKLGVSIRDLAAMMRTDWRAIQRYETNERDIPGPVALLLEAFLSGWRPE